MQYRDKSDEPLLEAQDAGMVLKADTSLNPAERIALDSILQLLSSLSGIDFSQYRQTTVLRRLRRRMGFTKNATLEAYRAHLDEHPDEAHRLNGDLLLSITEFFRDPAAFDALKTQVLPVLLNNTSTKSAIRVWVPGCSTGEEVYSLAILLHELLEQHGSKLTVQFFGTDVSEKNVAAARAAVYSVRAVANITPERLDRYFDGHPGGFQVTKLVRETCVFATQDLTCDPPFANIDLISCRNVLIYFKSSFQEVAIPLLHFALKPDGYLWLGSSETLAHSSGLFTVVDSKSSIFKKRLTSLRPKYQFPTTHPVRERGSEPPKPLIQPRAVLRRVPLDAAVDRLLVDEYAPACVVVDSQLQIQQFRGQTSPFLQPATGAATLKLSKMVRSELMPDLVVAIAEARDTRSRVHKRDLTCSTNGGNDAALDISVFPISGEHSEDLNYLIAFEERRRERPSLTAGQGHHSSETEPVQISQQQHELQALKRHLQAIIEEKDEVNLDLWAANEEIQSANEELQSVNEEMEAAKEELESTNEELVTLNEELQLKNAALSASEDRFRGLIESSPDWVWEMDARGTLTYSSPRVEQIVGYLPEEVVGRQPTEFMSASEVSRLAPILQSAAESGVALRTLRNTMIHKDGREVILETSSVTIVGSDGNVLGFRGMNRDITERFKADEELRQSEERLLRTQRIARLGHVEVNLRTNQVYWSQEVYDMFQRDPALPPLGLDAYLAAIHPDDRESLGGAVQRAIREGTSERLEFRTDPSSRPVSYFDCRFSPTLDGGGRPTSLVGTLLDITELKTAEVERLALESRFKAYVEAAPDGIFVADHTGSYVDVNPAACRLAGLSRPELLGASFLSLVHPEDHALVSAHFQVLMSEGQTNVDFRHIDKTGAIRHWNASTVRLSDTRFLAFIKDLTDHVQAELALQASEEQLRHAEKMQAVGQLAGGVAHDFNNQLTAVLAYAELLKGEVEGQATLVHYGEEIISGVKRAADLTAQLLAFSRKGKFLSVPVDLHRIASEVSELLKRTVDKRIEVRLQLAARPSTTLGDPTQLQNAILNLALNARDAMPNGGLLTITTQRVDLTREYCESCAEDIEPGPYIELVVSDTGLGIQPDALPRIFEPFFSTKAADKGTGMGLASVYGAIVGHRGAIRVESAPNEGTSFRLFLVLVDRQPADSVYPTKPQSAQGKARLLLVEDEHMLRSAETLVLEQLGYSVTACANGPEAIRYFETNWRDIDLVILDMVMPVMNGTQTFLALREIDPNVTAILASGYSLEGETEDALDSGVQGFVQKPFRMEELATKISEVLARRRESPLPQKH